MKMVMINYIKPRNPNYEKMREAVNRLIADHPGVMVPLAAIADEAAEFLKVEPGHALYDEALEMAVEIMVDMADEKLKWEDE